MSTFSFGLSFDPLDTTTNGMSDVASVLELISLFTVSSRSDLAYFPLPIISFATDIWNSVGNINCFWIHFTWMENCIIACSHY